MKGEDETGDRLAQRVHMTQQHKREEKMLSDAEASSLPPVLPEDVTQIKGPNNWTRAF